ncbi:hypothetical protein VNO80_19784 [Phaseolus coccineus]|uniref:Uncharacterized protein n=1 Tax=Phaseolus coccineus TaxID=3886 RepID=A0AAN9MGQ1_PHACN
MAERGDRSPINPHSEPNIPFGATHPSPLSNNSSPSSSSQNPFLFVSDAPNTNHVGAYESEKEHDHLHSLSAMKQERGGMTNNSVTGFPDDGILDPHLSLAPSNNESSPENPFHVPTSSIVGSESHHTHPSPDRGHWGMASSEAWTHPSNTHSGTLDPFASHQLEPLFSLESAHYQEQTDTSSKNRADASTTPTSVEQYDPFSVTNERNYGMSSSNSGTEERSGSSFPPAFETSTQDHMSNSANSSTKAPQKRGKDVKFATETTEDDIPISSFPNHGQEPSDGSPAFGNGSEKQNPPIQVMERPENPSTSSNYRFPSHVFDRHKSKSNTQWSTASNESLFSIQMGNTSFSSDMGWMTKSGEMEKLGDMNTSGASYQGNQPPLPPQPQPQPQPRPASTKFTDISQSTAKQHEGSKVTEEKAAETMREVIMESNIKRDCTNNADLINPKRAISSDMRSNSKSHSQHSDASTKSFAFNVYTDGDKTLSPKQEEEKKKQQQQPEQENLKATSDAVQTPKQTPNAPQNKSWLSCFSCC